MKNKILKIFLLIIFFTEITSCASHKIINNEDLKTEQFYKKNSGSNYVFISNTTQDGRAYENNK